MTLIVATDSRNVETWPVDRRDAHERGLIHRAVHVEVQDNAGRLLIWRRRDGRLEIPGGHVDWLSGEGRAESYLECASRELCEELALAANWGIPFDTARERVAPLLASVAIVSNQLPGRSGKNNEWVNVFQLLWQEGCGDPAGSNWTLDPEEGMSAATWLAVDEIERRCLLAPALPTAALRLLLLRRGVLVPFV
jgi:8-oxo-dGTP pyrophosphatase MutT (NUDIX family)